MGARPAPTPGRPTCGGRPAPSTTGPTCRSPRACASTSADARGPSIWLDEPHTPRAALAGDRSCEVCVIGAGVAGLSAAWHLLGLGVRATVLEAGSVAGGASGRNGGFFIAGVAPSHAEACALWGRELAARRHRATLAAQAEMLEVARQVGALEDFRVEGILRLAAAEDEAARVRENLEALRRDSFPGRLVPEAELPPVLRRPGRLGLLTPNDGSVHPVRWLRKLARALEERGVAIFEGTRVLAPPSPAGSRVEVVTARGRVHAERVLVAADGQLAELVPSASRVRARRLNMLATAPAPRLLTQPVYARDGHEYVQQLADGRLALGGFSDLDGDESWTAREEPSARVQARLDRYLAEELGVSPRVTHRWAGVVGYADDPAPTCAAVPGSQGRILAAGGYNGTGHVQGFLCGRIAAELAAGVGSADAGLYAAIEDRRKAPVDDA